MARPYSTRRIGAGLKECLFTPQGRRTGPSIVLAFDELEALRLADLWGLHHEEAARKMGVSRQTFGRIVETARRKVVDAIISRKCLKIECGRNGKPARILEEVSHGAIE